MNRSCLIVLFAGLIPAAAVGATGDVVTSFPSSFPSPDGLAWDGATLWATDCGSTRIDKIDPETGEVLESIDVTGVFSDELAWDGAALWVSDHTATEMPGMGAPPPRLYHVDPADGRILESFDAPGRSQYPMGLAAPAGSLWNVDPWDRLIFELDPATGDVRRTIPAPAAGACGLAWDGACLWVTDATEDGLVYHLDPATGDVISSFAGPGGPGHLATGVAWDGANLWVHDEAAGRARIYKLVVDDITEAGRCDATIGPGDESGEPSPDAGDGDDIAADGGDVDNPSDIPALDDDGSGDAIEPDPGADSATGCSCSTAGASLASPAFAGAVLLFVLTFRRRKP